MEQQVETQEVGFLDKVYSFVINGIPKVDKPILQVVNEYLSRYHDSEKAIKEFIPNFEHEEKGKNLDQKM